MLAMKHNLQHGYSRDKVSLRRTCTPIMASIGTSVLGMLTACGGRYIGSNMPNVHSDCTLTWHAAWH